MQCNRIRILFSNRTSISPSIPCIKSPRPWERSNSSCQVSDWAFCFALHLANYFVVYGLDNDLVFALIHQDETQLQDVLRRGQKAPLAFKERKQGSLEFAIRWPRGLAMILEQRAATDIDSYLDNGAAVLAAMSIGLARCARPDYDPRVTMCEPDCECATSLKLLLEAGSHVDMARVNWGWTPLRPVHVLLSHLQRGRGALRELAGSTLPSDLKMGLGLDADAVLDYRAGKVTRALQSHGINPAERLGWPRHDIRLKDPQQ